MNGKVGIVDYGMGNLHSVAKALSAQGADIVVSDQKKTLTGCSLLVVPGVGFFGAGMTVLAKLNLDDFLRKWLEDGKPYLGICLGFQFLFEKSEESPGVCGLGALKGEVRRFSRRDPLMGNLPVPHMGWNQAKKASQTSDAYFEGINSEAYFYFVHSYYCAPLDKSVVATSTSYGIEFCSSVSRPGLFASQFHPEKSGTNGLTLLKNVLKNSQFISTN